MCIRDRYRIGLGSILERANSSPSRSRRSAEVTSSAVSSTSATTVSLRRKSPLSFCIELCRSHTFSAISRSSLSSLPSLPLVGGGCLLGGYFLGKQPVTLKVSNSFTSPCTSDTSSSTYSLQLHSTFSKSVLICGNEVFNDCIPCSSTLL
eukprot:TRINITY_DN12982_c0_g2_i1.p1 TRINITY_DN12982_c0_g2~~TRINITY_DN12982_c0_g2_i1.p1  ORF type:complete len:150 (+),score=4.76 TRINITY_DN12982_c0_g2_i1:64-513(+)